MAWDRIKTLIEASKSFGILLDPNPEEHEFLAKEILEQAISEKKIPVISLPEEYAGLKEKWLSILKNYRNASLLQKTSIKLPKEKYTIKEISYEENENYLSLILTPKTGGLSKEDLVFENLPPQTDAVFCLFENQEKLGAFQNKLKIPEREKIIFITTNEKTLTEKVFDITKIFNPNLLTNRSLSTLFYAALTQETNNFSEKITKETLSLGSLFLENGAQKEIISGIMEQEKTFSLTQILGRLMARTYIDELLKISWSFLSHRDLQKTQNTSASPLFLYNLLKKLRSLLPLQRFYVLIWQSTEGIRSLITAATEEDKNLLIPLARNLQTEPQSNFFTAGPFENFSRAELRLRQVFKEVLNKL